MQAVDRWQTVVQELVRVVKPGGTLVLATLTNSLFRRQLYRLLALAGRQPGPPPRLFSIASLLATLQAQGMTAPEVLTLYYPLRWRQFSTGDGLLQNVFSSSFVIRARKPKLRKGTREK